MPGISLGLGIPNTVKSLYFLPSDLPNQVAWYRYNTGITVSMSGVSQWNDQSGNGNHLIQTTDSWRPVKESDGSILFDGVVERLRGVFTLVQPETIYILFKQLSHANVDTVYDGEGGDTGVLRQMSPSPNITFYAGGFIGTITTLPLGVYGIITTVVNGASSILQLNNETPIPGDSGSGNMNGINVAMRPLIGRFGNIQVKEIVIFNTVPHTTQQITQMITYLNNVGGGVF
jgi:hypothetical protein